MRVHSADRCGDTPRSLNNLSSMLSELGQQQPALEAAVEAVAHYRQLADQGPDRFLPNLAGSLNNLSNRLSELGQYEPALDASTESVSIYRQLAEQEPDSFLPILAVCLHNLSKISSKLGRSRAALDAITESVERILPVLEQSWHVLPDSGAQLTERYVACCQDSDEGPDDTLIERLTTVLRAGGMADGTDVDR